MTFVIGAVCPTYKRPHLLGRAIYGFEQQTHKDKYLIVVDDAQQLKSQEGDKWRLISVDQRFPNLGAKRQFGVGLLPKECDAYMCMDDDDLLFPHALSSIAAALENSEASWAQPRYVFESAGDKLAVTPAFGSGVRAWGYGGSWCYKLEQLRMIGGYLDAPGADDLRLANKFHAMFGESADSTPDKNPWYWYCRDPGVNKVSTEGIGFWEKRAHYDKEESPVLNIGWNGRNIYDLEVLPGIQKRPW